MSIPVPDQRPAEAATPSLLPKVVVVHAGDVNVDAAPEHLETDPAVRANPLVEADAIAKQNGPTPEVDRAQEEVMTAISPDGRPPERELRTLEWKWVLIAGAVLLACTVVAVTVSSIAWPTVLFAGVIVLVLIGAAIPTWGAGLLRGGEERQARASALGQKEQEGPKL